ncbi:hypothetical protein FH972_015823 [Carpinus fangiana]|uniref:Uncharacterized protein n=1 Tax=Carpinus fangiana TaxID=176857 RepID=A0A5N6RF55_9ROSI|nr:hypothetical protein FH972_015823 [Carpinus fangiana]
MALAEWMRLLKTIVGLAPTVAGHDKLGSLAVMGRRCGSTSLACFKRRSCESPAVWFGGLTAMRVWARIFDNGKSSTAVTGEFLASCVSTWTPMVA